MFNAHLYNSTMSDTGTWAWLPHLKETFKVCISIFPVFFSSPVVDSPHMLTLLGFNNNVIYIEILSGQDTSKNIIHS